MEVLSFSEIITRLVVIFILSGAIGAEREYYRKPAGLRTLIIVGLGSALFTLISFRIREIFPSALADPGRIASQIIVGIGFIGAGTILRARGSIVGLTTAATIFIVAGIGMAVGYGLYTEAIATTILVLLNFFVISYIVKFIREKSKIPSEIEEGSEEEFKDVVMH